MLNTIDSLKISLFYKTNIIETVEKLYECNKKNNSDCREISRFLKLSTIIEKRKDYETLDKLLDMINNYIFDNSDKKKDILEKCENEECSICISELKKI